MILEFTGKILKLVSHVREKPVDYVEVLLECTKPTKQGFTYLPKNGKVCWGKSGQDRVKVSLLKDFSSP